MVPLVYVHLGSTNPRWLLWNISRSRQLFQNEVHLISDNRRLLKSAKRLGAKVFFWESKPWFTRLTKRQSLHGSFWQGFWIFSGLRFVALSQFHNTIPNLPLLHLESDVILHPGYGTSWTNAIKDQLAGSRLSSDRTGGALIYSPNAVLTNKLMEEIVVWFEQNPNTNEMLGLESFRKGNSEIWCDLPTVPASHPELFHRHLDIHTRIELSSNFRQFSGLFDVAGVGQYLLGTDARFNRGYSKIRHSFPDQFLNISNWAFTTDTYGWPSVIWHDEAVPLYSLHVHSKKRMAFTDSFNSARIQKIIRSYNASPQEIFDAWALIQIMRNYCRR